MTALLDRISGPADVKALAPGDLAALAVEIRSHLVASVARTGGHLGPNLGVVELTIALHRAFDSPRDVLLWDTGHQAYVHKMLTGRASAFHSLRQAGGLSGYPSQAESPHDVIENSHASTALSYADGIAKAFALAGHRERTVVAVVGDGALTGGMCWEALNNIAEQPDRRLVIVVNDNGRSYAPTVGALNRVVAEAFFTDLGLPYVGPVDGHDLTAVEDAFRRARALDCTVVVHCRTRKGAGYAPAEVDEADCMHGVGTMDPATGQPKAVGGALPWTQVFADELVEVGRERSDVVAVTAAMLRPVGLHPFAEAFPDRVFDVGIAEQHAVASAAGLALGGMHPVVCVYATFLNRAFDQLLMDVALHRLPVTFVLDRAGVTGDDGPSHHGMWDLSVLGVVPGIRVGAPRDAARLRQQLREAVECAGPTVLRFPKAQAGVDLAAIGRVGNADVLRAHVDADALIIGVGPMAGESVAAADRLAEDGLAVTVLDPRWLYPLDQDLADFAAAYRYVITVEDNGLAGGYGSALAQAVHERSPETTVRNVGLPQQFLAHGTRSAILSAHGLDAAGIAGTVADVVRAQERYAVTR